MTNNLLIDLIVNKIRILDDYTVDYIEDNINTLTPAGKYQAFLITSSIVINRLRAINAFQLNSINIDLFKAQLLNEAEKKFIEYKKIHDVVYNTFKHRSAIIEGRLNRENRECFYLNKSDLKQNSYVMIGIYNLELDTRISFNQIYFNLFVHPFFNTNLTDEEQKQQKHTYLSIIKEHNVLELENFNSKISKLVNDISTKLNEDSFFMTKMSKINPNSGDNKNCYIATLVYKDIEHPRVILLREYRDTVLIKNNFGRQFIKVYYKISPKLVEVLRPYPFLQKIIKKILDTLTKELIKNR
jgi:hypothetical protein